MTDEEIEKFADSARQIEHAFVQMAEGMAPLVRAFGQHLQSLHDHLRAAYGEAGAPYGDGDEDMMLWYQDAADLWHAEKKRREIAERVQMRAALRENGLI